MPREKILMIGCPPLTFFNLTKKSKIRKSVKIDDVTHQNSYHGSEVNKSKNTKKVLRGPITSAKLKGMSYVDIR